MGDINIKGKPKEIPPMHSQRLQTSGQSIDVCPPITQSNMQVDVTQ
jgi:hypothetical protein